MKKISLLLFLSIFIATSVIAQEKPSFGFKVGLNFVDFNADEIDLDGSTGFHAGIALHVPLVKKYGVQAEALYSIENGEFEAGDIDLSYLNIPVLLTYKIAPGLRAQLGPQFKVNVKSDISFDGSDLEVELRDQEEDFEDDVNSLNFDAVAGLEYKFPAIGIFLQARYNFGVTKAIDFDDIKVNSFQLSVGYIYEVINFKRAKLKFTRNT